MSNSAQAAYAPFQPQTFDLEAAQSTQSGPINPALSISVGKAVGLSEQTFAPESAIRRFQNSAPELEDIQQTLVGSQLGSELDWGKIRNKSNTDTLSVDVNDSDKANKLVMGGLGSILGLHTSSAKRISNSSRNQTANSESSLLVHAGNVGSYCTQDGLVVLAMTPHPEGEGDGGDGDSGSGADDDDLVPVLDFPETQILGSSGSVEDFSLTDHSSSSSISVFGSFTPASLDNPDLDATGMNWVHSVDRTWISPTQWSITERLVAAYNLSSDESDSGDNSSEEVEEDGGEDADSSSNNGDLTSGGNNEGEASDSGLDETSSWSSTISVTRRGFIILTMIASQGISTPAAAGVNWSISFSFSDTIDIQADANGSATYVPAVAVVATGTTSGNSGQGGMTIGGEGDPQGSGESDIDSSDLPEDFQGESEWSAGIGLTATSSGTLVISSTPSIGSDGAISRSIIADVNYDVGGDLNLTSDWSASSSSGSLVLPGQPNQGGPNPLIGCDWEGLLSDAAADFGDDTSGWGLPGSNDPLPTEPIGPIEGSGHASASSGSGNSKLGGNIKGGWDLQGVLKGSSWESLTGGAMAALKADTGGAGKSKHVFIYKPEPTVVPLSDGDITTKILLISGWDHHGTTKELADAIGNEVFSKAPDGDLQSDSTGSSAKIIGDPDITGFSFLVIQASSKLKRLWDSPLGVGHKIDEDKLDYTSFDQGTGKGEYKSVLAGTTPPSASVDTDLNGKGGSILVLTATFDHVWDGSPQNYGSGLSSDHTNDQEDRTTTLTSEYTINGKLSGVLLADDSVGWSGTAGENSKFTVKYRQNWNRTDTQVSDSPGGGYVYNLTRTATYDATLVLSDTLNAAAGTVTSTATRSGDQRVLVVTNGYGDLPTLDESKLEAIITGISPPELEYPVGSNVGTSTSVKPSTSYAMALIGWFGGSAGDSGDRAINFTAGVADAMTMNVSYLTRNAIGADNIDYDGDYNGGQIVGTTVGIVAGGPALIKGAVQGAKAIGTGAANLTKCGTALGKLIGRDCFVAGTLVTLSELPRQFENESTLWANDEWDVEAYENQSELSLSPAGSSRLATLSPIRTLLPIEQVPLGARVPTKNPESWDYDFSLPDPVRESWVKITILYESNDGHIVDVELIRPRTWVETNEVIEDTWIILGIPEIGIHGMALVMSIEECPALAEGSGNIVTGRFVTRQVNTIVRAEIIGVDGAIETIEGTTMHRFWSVDRNGWVHLGEMEAGEQLQGRDGNATVLSVAIEQKSVPVYNIEVFGEHVYAVGVQSLLVHNVCGEDILQRGGQTLLTSTAKALNSFHDVSKHGREWGRALEALKRSEGLGNAHHGMVLRNGDYVDMAKNVLGNLLEWL